MIYIIGRTDEILRVPTPQGDMIPMVLLAMVTVAEETPGVSHCQCIQTEPLKLTMHLAVKETEVEETEKKKRSGKPFEHVCFPLFRPHLWSSKKRQTATSASEKAEHPAGVA